MTCYSEQNSTGGTENHKYQHNPPYCFLLILYFEKNKRSQNYILHRHENRTCTDQEEDSSCFGVQPVSSYMTTAANIKGTMTAVTTVRVT